MDKAIITDLANTLRLIADQVKDTCPTSAQSLEWQARRLDTFVEEAMKARKEAYSRMPDGSHLQRKTDEHFTNFYVGWDVENNACNYTAVFDKANRRAKVWYKGRQIMELADAGNEFMERVMRACITSHIKMRMGKERRRTAKKIRLRAKEIKRLSFHLHELEDAQAIAVPLFAERHPEEI